MQDMTMLWNGILTLAIGGFLWWIKGTNTAIAVVRRDLRDHALSDAKTREHMAIHYATKSEVKDDLQQIMTRFDRLENKIDKLNMRGK
jgi:hypothetical protein|tara:strand:- start:34 stop:297 length:264 start_codon:yes stop_codon:yes gene_type:complete